MSNPSVASASPSSKILQSDPATWPASRQLALMTLARSEITRPVVEHLKSRGTARAGQGDYGWLIGQRIAAREVSRFSGKPYLRLTPWAQAGANAIAWSMAKDLRLHVFRRGGGDRYSLSLTCSCGWSCGLSLNEGHIDSQIGNARARHLENVKNGWTMPKVPLVCFPPTYKTPSVRARCDDPARAINRERAETT